MYVRSIYAEANARAFRTSPRCFAGNRQRKRALLWRSLQGVQLSHGGALGRVVVRQGVRQSAAVGRLNTQA